MSSCADFFFTFCPKAWSASATSASLPTEAGKAPSHAAASCSALLRAQIAPKQPTCCVAPPAPAPCWSSNGSPALNFTSGQTRTSPPHRGAALTAHKIAIAYHGSTPVPDGMLAHARLSCAHKLPKHPIYGTCPLFAGFRSAHLRGFTDSAGLIPRPQWPQSVCWRH